MVDLVVYLVPVGSGRYELYSEPADAAASGDTPPNGRGFWHGLSRDVQERWRRATHAAQLGGESGGRLARARDWMVRRVAQSIAEQRTLWLLRDATTASFVHPSELSAASAADIRARMLAHARRHHGWWLMLNLVGVAVTAALAILPGPNLVAYYFALRAVGHALSWRGARQARDRITWRVRADPALTELGRLAHLSRDERAARVAGIAADLHLPRLPALFDRTAVPER